MLEGSGCAVRAVSFRCVILYWKKTIYLRSTVKELLQDRRLDTLTLAKEFRSTDISRSIKLPRTWAWKTETNLS